MLGEIVTRFDMRFVIHLLGLVLFLIKRADSLDDYLLCHNNIHLKPLPLGKNIFWGLTILLIGNIIMSSHGKGCGGRHCES